MSRNIEKLEDINDLNDLVYFITNRMSTGDVEWIKNYEILDEKDYLAEAHHSLGKSIRNNCGLWEPDSHLRCFFKEKYDLDHPDDMSGIILLKIFKILHENFDENWIGDELKRYKDHWKMINTLEESNGVYELDFKGQKVKISYAKIPYSKKNNE